MFLALLQFEILTVILTQFPQLRKLSIIECIDIAKKAAINGTLNITRLTLSSLQHAYDTDTFCAILIYNQFDKVLTIENNDYIDIGKVWQFIKNFKLKVDFSVHSNLRFN